MNGTSFSEFQDDHGRAFGDALERLNAESGATHPATLCELICREASAFGQVRTADPSNALRILALDGMLTERIGEKLAAGEAIDLERIAQILAPKSGTSGR